eukprot:EG_transcript_35112
MEPWGSFSGCSLRFRARCAAVTALLVASMTVAPDCMGMPGPTGQLWHPAGPRPVAVAEVRRGPAARPTAVRRPPPADRFARLSVDPPTDRASRWRPIDSRPQVYHQRPLPSSSHITHRSPWADVLTSGQAGALLAAGLSLLALRCRPRWWAPPPMGSWTFLALGPPSGPAASGGPPAP